MSKVKTNKLFSYLYEPFFKNERMPAETNNVLSFNSSFDLELESALFFRVWRR